MSGKCFRSTWVLWGMHTSLRTLHPQTLSTTTPTHVSHALTESVLIVNMQSPSNEQYPRPDFAPSSQHSNPPTGPWYFLCADEQVSLSARWSQTGPPRQVMVGKLADIQAVPSSESKSITV